MVFSGGLWASLHPKNWSEARFQKEWAKEAAWQRGCQGSLPDTQAVAWFLLTAFLQSYGENGEKVAQRNEECPLVSRERTVLRAGQIWSCLRPCTGTVGTVPTDMKTPEYKNANSTERRVPGETLQGSLGGGQTCKSFARCKWKESGNLCQDSRKPMNGGIRFLYGGPEATLWS